MALKQERWRGLGIDEAKRFYDSMGRKQDLQFYERRALSTLIRLSDFDRAESTFELGCGTGRLAAELLARSPGGCMRYRGVDISETMVRIGTRRLIAWRDRAEVQLIEGARRLDAESGTFDRFVSTYVFDLMSDEDIQAALAEAHRILKDDGLLCAASLTRGDTPMRRLATAAWEGIFAIKPYLVGGCRPIELERRLPAGEWRVVHKRMVSSFGIATEVLVARPLPRAGEVE